MFWCIQYYYILKPLLMSVPTIHTYCDLFYTRTTCELLPCAYKPKNHCFFFSSIWQCNLAPVKILDGN